MDVAKSLEPGIIEKASGLAADLEVLLTRLKQAGCDDRAYLVEDAYAAAQQIIRRMKKPTGFLDHDPPYRI